MKAPGDAALRQLAVTVIARYAGPNADAEAIAAAARRAHEELTRVSVPLIGVLGVDALTSRAVHLARREFAWLANTHEPGPAGETLGAVAAGLQRQDPAVAADGAAVVLAILGTLLAGLIGEGLTMRLLNQAWPSRSLEAREQEANT